MEWVLDTQPILLTMVNLRWVGFARDFSAVSLGRALAIIRLKSVGFVRDSLAVLPDLVSVLCRQRTVRNRHRRLLRVAPQWLVLPVARRHHHSILVGFALDFSAVLRGLVTVLLQRQTVRRLLLRVAPLRLVHHHRRLLRVAPRWLVLPVARRHRRSILVGFALDFSAVLRGLVSVTMLLKLGAFVLVCLAVLQGLVWVPYLQI